MIVNFEFLDTEPIENMITCLHFKIDKVIFFGFGEVIGEKRKTTDRFLKKYCGVKEVFFYPISETKPDEAADLMRCKMEEEQKSGHQCYLDITGGEGIALLAFGMLKKEMNIPLHMYDVRKDALLEFDEEKSVRLSTNVPPQHVKMDLDIYIEMQGGVVNYKQDGGYRPVYTEEVYEEIRTLWKVYRQNLRDWNHFSTVISKYPCDLTVEVGEETVRADLNRGKKDWFFEKLPRLLETCKKAKLLTNVAYGNGTLTYTYKNEFVKMCMNKAGNILEQYTYLLEKDRHDDCRVGVHLDWDGVIHQKKGQDVLNEIDVLALDGYIPTFISCKGGEVSQNALYELETVAGRFGGRYAKCSLTVSRELSESHALRAEEMGIAVRKL